MIKTFETAFEKTDEHGQMAAYLVQKLVRLQEHAANINFRERVLGMQETDVIDFPLLYKAFKRHIEELVGNPPKIEQVVEPRRKRKGLTKHDESSENKGSLERRLLIHGKEGNIPYQKDQGQDSVGLWLYKTSLEAA